MARPMNGRTMRMCRSPGWPSLCAHAASRWSPRRRLISPDKGDQGPGAPYNAAAKFYSVYSGEQRRDHDLRISHIAIDRAHTTAEDQGSYFPLAGAAARAAARPLRHAHPKISWAAHQPQSAHDACDVDCPELVRRCAEDGADAAMLVPNCPGLSPDGKPRGARPRKQKASPR